VSPPSEIPGLVAAGSRFDDAVMAALPPRIPDWALGALSDVFDPCCREKGISVVDMGLLRSVQVHGGHARVELLLTSGWCPFAGRLLMDVADAINTQPGIDSCEVDVVWDEPWTTDRLSESARRTLRFLPDPIAVGDRDAYLATHPSPEDSHDR
jgi:metal-sulfur cluster biosynthetic enzyme